VAKILVVEDDPAVRDVVEHALSREGMETATVENGEEALERLRGEPFDLVVLDVMLPGIDGISVCRELRADGENGDIPVVMLTARDDEINVVVGLEVGADDYVTKPFSPRELVSRVRAHLRRRSLDARKAEASSTSQKRLEFPGLTVDLLRRQVVLDGKEVELTAREFDVLALLASHPGRVYSREQIMRHLWDGDFFGEARAADVHIQHIRHKVEPDPKNPRYVRTVRGAGYRFAEF
jgi:two-component system, OmpR family, alkaline phosphatase synthesis response regulator PhoP